MTGPRSGRVEQGTLAADPIGSLSGKAFAKADKAAPKRDDHWIFVVDPVTGALPENSRAILDQVARDPELTKIILTRSRRVDLSGANIVITPLHSPTGREHLLGSRVMFLPGRPLRALDVRPQLDLHHLVSVRGGLMLAKGGRAAEPAQHPGAEPPPVTGPLQMLHKAPRRDLTAVLTASDVDQVAEIAAHWPARYADGWRTGVPLHDYLVAGQLPGDLAEQEGRLRELLAGRRLLLVIWAPRGGRSWPPPREDGPELAHVLGGWARAHDAVIGVRESLTDPASSLGLHLGEVGVDLSARRFESTSVVLRAADALLTDYDGGALDFTVTGRPVVAYAPDLSRVADHLLYDLEHIFPGPVCGDADELALALSTVFGSPTAQETTRYRRSRDLLIDHRDGQSSARVVHRVRELVEGGQR